MELKVGGSVVLYKVCCMEQTKKQLESDFPKTDCAYCYINELRQCGKINSCSDVRELIGECKAENRTDYKNVYFKKVK